MRSAIFLVAAAAAVVQLAGCSSKLPPAQQEFMKLVDQMQDDYSEADSKDNAILEKEVADKYKNAMYAAGQDVVKWKASVKEIGDTFGTLVVAQHGDVKFKMVMVTDEGKKLASSLKRGDEVTFSGKLGHEVSFTSYGMVKAPEFAFTPSEIGKGDDPLVTQP
ncbi:hypothetical protein G4G28_12945 [Massilia sp. Dwa41.01b]|uniref:hypothetical protein n=1 Tax=unclassified Massilia TaxID=2609279 RepID=UPI0016016574|nr:MULTISPECIES: hypothetical protein [unclassified Massilia]QNA89154.1 hypothetical protein G4G28_12945 [Massilia sp. Dwa41.01b]QNB00047.1 hypothetical protein G4G31_16510 [Massilia sp. Se16.2.3]